VHYNVNEEEMILREFEENPGNNVRRVARMLSLSQYVVNRVLHQNGLHQYRYQRVQELLPRDHEQRINFCEGTFLIFFLSF